MSDISDTTRSLLLGYAVIVTLLWLPLVVGGIGFYLGTLWQKARDQWRLKP